MAEKVYDSGTATPFEFIGPNLLACASWRKMDREHLLELEAMTCTWGDCIYRQSKVEGGQSNQLKAALETPAAARKAERPDPQWVNGTCPDCGEETVSNAYYVGGRGYLLFCECWASLGETPRCSYRRQVTG